MIELTENQKKVVTGAASLIKFGRSIVTIAGAAGTSKTTLIPYIIKELGYKKREVRYCAFTGKAARVLRNKGLPASTIHRLIYKPFYDKRLDKVYFLKKSPFDVDLLGVKLVVVDEISMVGEKLLEDLLSFGFQLICLGDPYQLQPVLDDSNTLLSEPDFLLEEIFRQQDGNSIVDYANKIRLEDQYNFPKPGDNFVKILGVEDFNIKVMEWGDQIICCTNKNRNAINRIMREARGIDKPVPVQFDKLICTKNYWNIISKNGEPLTNGTIGYVSAIQYFEDSQFDKYADIKFIPDYDTTDSFTVRISLNNFYDLKMQQDVKNPQRNAMYRCQFDFAYAITCHKAQGSEFDKVVFYAADAWGDKAKLLYTGVTRAKDKLVYVE